VVRVDEEFRDKPVTVVELTMEHPVTSGQIIGGSKIPEFIQKAKGDLISQNAVVSASSPMDDSARAKTPEFFSEEKATEPALLTLRAKETWATIDLGKAQTATLIEIDNAPFRRATRILKVSVSLDGQEWDEIYASEGPHKTFKIPVTRFHAGIDVVGREIRYIKLTGIGEDRERPLQLMRMRVYGQ
jgi:hypothetical protein